MKFYNLLLITTAIGAFLFICGCDTQDHRFSALEPLSKEALFARLQEKQLHLREFAAKGSATVHLIAENKTESMNNVTVYFADKQNMMIRIAHPFGTAVSLGTNPDEFWFWLNFGKVNDFYSGSAQSLQNCQTTGIKTFPATEALGIVDIDKLRAGKLTSNSDGYIIELTEPANETTQTYYFDKAANLVLLTYYEQEFAMMIAEFGEYKPVADELKLPTDITVYSVEENIRLNLKVSRFAPITLDSERKAKLFSPPKPSSEANKFLLEENCQFRYQLQ